MITCNWPFEDCDEDSSNGCEANTQIDVSHCGGCGSVCEGVFAEGVCSAGSCALVCEEGRFDCDNDPENGCETDLLATETCGACDNSCLGFQRALAASCDAIQQSCRIDRCEEGWGNCDNDVGNGCETDLLSDPNNCGECAQACRDLNNTEPGLLGTCSQGVCELHCKDGWANCDGKASNGCETDVSMDDPKQCGQSCLVCAVGETCLGGACQEDRESQRWPAPPDVRQESEFLIGAETVEDKITGLVWQAEASGGTMSWTEAFTHCGGLKLADASDWRVPSIQELSTIINFDFIEALNATVFTDMDGSQSYWSASTNLNPLQAEVIHETVLSNRAKTSTDTMVRCVRGGFVPTVDRFQPGPDTVVDRWTSLEWQRQVFMEAGDGGEQVLEVDWESATDLCANLNLGGKGDWRLPTVRELFGLLDFGYPGNPRISPLVFPDTPAQEHWTNRFVSVPLGPDMSLELAWLVTFYQGLTSPNTPDVSAAVRCVRSWSDAPPAGGN